MPRRGPVIWDLKTGTTASPPPIPGIEDQGAVAWISPESRFVWTSATPIKFWDVKTGEICLALQARLAPALRVKDSQRQGNDQSRDDRRRQAAPELLRAPREAPSNPAAAPAPGKRVTAPPQVNADSAPIDPWVATSLRLHDIETGRLLFEMDYAGMTFLGLVPGTNTCVCEAADGTISFRDLKTGHELRRVTLRLNPPLRKSSPWDGYELRLMSPMNDVSGMPLVGYNLIVIATVSNALHFRIFDLHGSRVVDTVEKSLTHKVEIEDFKGQLKALWPPHKLKLNEKNRLIAAVTSIVGNRTLDHPQGGLPENPKLTADGKQLVKPIWERGFGLFDLDSGAEVACFKTSEASGFWPLETLVLAPPGRMAVVYRQWDVHLWTLPSPAAAPSQALARKAEPPLVRKLAGTATNVAVGGAGRYLLVTLADERQLAVFDVNTAEVVKRLPLAAENALIAAGASKFVIAYPDSKQIERWDLGTLTRDGDPRAVPVAGTLEAIALGADSEGPLLASWWFGDTAAKRNRLSFVDLAEFKVLAVGLIAVHGCHGYLCEARRFGGRFRVSPWRLEGEDAHPRVLRWLSLRRLSDE